MSLEERRKNAEDMILKIAKFMNLDEDEVDLYDIFLNLLLSLLFNNIFSSDEEENHEEN